jgi:hypothetical protein
MRQPRHAPDQRIDALRVAMRDAIESAPAFHQLPAEERHKIARNLMAVASYLDDPGAGLPPGTAEVARALDDSKQQSAVEEYKATAGKQNLVGKDFKAGATEAGTKAFGDLVKSVDFVGFVAGLIHGVYDSIVSASIKQMMAFSQFLEAVVKSAKEFADDHVTPNQARDYLTNKFPNALQLDGTDQGQPKLALKPDLDDKDTPDFKSALGVDANLDDEDGEAQIVQAAQLQMAKQKQQMISQMLLMGINRIVVTEGEIKASVLFDVTMSDTASRTTAASFDDTQTHNDSSSSGNGWGSDSSNSTTNTRVSTAHANTADQSDSRLDAHAKLTGYVSVKFKGEAFPLERFASNDEQSAITENAKR